LSCLPKHPACNLSLVLDGSVDEQVSSGTVSVAVKFLGIPVLNASDAITDENVQLPFGSGPFVFKKTIEIPSSAPQGSYTTDITWKDQDGQSLVCVHEPFSL